MLKIAICLFGQLRTGIEASNSVKSYFGQYLNTADVFIHTWDINTHRLPLNLRKGELKITDISSDEILKYKQIYNSSRFCVESFEEFQSANIRYGDHNLDVVGVWHSLNAVNNIRKSFEISHNIRYDLVVCLRPDCIFPPDRYFDDDLNEIINNLSNTCHIIEHFGDSIFIGNSHVIDKISDFYLYGNFYGSTHFWPFDNLKDYLMSHGLVTKNLADNRTTVLREIVKHLDVKDRYWEINAVNDFLYDQITHAKNNILNSYRNLNDPEWHQKAESNLRSLFGQSVCAEYFTKKSDN